MGMEMNGTTATDTKESITMTNFTTTAINLLARNEGIHPARMANRLSLAMRVVEAATEIAEGRTSAATIIRAAINGMPEMVAELTEGAAPKMGVLTDSTLALALEIASA